MSGRELEDAAKHRLGIGNPQKGQKLVERFGIKFSADSVYLQQCFNLGCEGKAVAVLEVVKGLHPEVVASHEQRRRSRAEVADGESEHAIEPLYTIRAFLLVEVQDHLGISVRGKTVPLTFELATKIGEIVDFAVVGDPDGAVLIAHGHVAVGGKVENGEAAAAQAYVRSVWKS